MAPGHVLTEDCIHNHIIQPIFIFYPIDTRLCRNTLNNVIELSSADTFEIPSDFARIKLERIIQTVINEMANAMCGLHHFINGTRHDGTINISFMKDSIMIEINSYSNGGGP